MCRLSWELGIEDVLTIVFLVGGTDSVGESLFVGKILGGGGYFMCGSLFLEWG